MMIRIEHKVPDHLRRLRVLDMDMLLLAHRLHEILMHQFPDLPPRVVVVHDEKVIPLRDQPGHDGFGPVAVYVALFVEQVLDELAVGNDERGVRESLEAEDPAVLSRPLCQPGLRDSVFSLWAFGEIWGCPEKNGARQKKKKKKKKSMRK